ncbi:helix-turn-helix domain-containing protein [Umezawaea sp. NPDC059074]|uniref:helix-turn-helix domain-containing protein n=1 Tax=Umezawaea sp. NPDC059074 TaxID=3346716 RepID=UPI0036C79CEB
MEQMKDLSDSDEPTFGESRLVSELRELRLSRSEPSYRLLADRTGRSPSTINDVLTGKRVPGWPVVRDLVSALDGDLDHFQKLYELGRSERLNLAGRADELKSELRLPVSTTTTDSSTQVVSHGGSVIIQSGAPASFNPLVMFAPADLVTTYEAACLAYASGAYLAVLTMVRSIVEAVCVRTDVGPDSMRGLALLAKREVLPQAVAVRGMSIVRRASAAIHGSEVASPVDAAAALAYVLTLLSLVYFINESGS